MKVISPAKWPESPAQGLNQCDLDKRRKRLRSCHDGLIRGVGGYNQFSCGVHPPALERVHFMFRAVFELNQGLVLEFEKRDPMGWLPLSIRALNHD